MRKICSFLLFLFGLTTFAENSNNEQFPLFHDCEGALGKQQEARFYNTIQNYFKQLQLYSRIPLGFLWDIEAIYLTGISIISRFNEFSKF